MTKVKELLRDFERGRDITQRDQMLADFLEDWLEFADDGKRQPKTIISYRQIVRCHIVPALGRTRLSKLTAKDVDELLMRMQRTGSSARTAQITRTVLNLAMKQAMCWDKVGRNVVSLTKNPTVTRAERHPLTADQLRHLIDHTREHRLGPLFQVAIATGMRQGELLGLHWRDVDLETGVLYVRQTLKRDKDGRLMFGTPKTPKSRRVIELPAFAVTALKEQRRRQAADAEWSGVRWESSDLVFTNSVGRPLDSCNVTHTLQDQIVAAGLPRQRFHDLRHAAATLLAAERIPANVARDMLGHTDVTMTLNVYTHANRAALRQAADAIGAALGLDEPAPHGMKQAS